MPALTAALATGTPLLLALTPARAAPRGVAPDAVPAPLRDIDVASGCAADYDGWLAEVPHERAALTRDLVVAQTRALKLPGVARDL